MPRAPREKSSTGVYHVMLRGINRQIIFEDDEDYQKYLDTLKTYQEKSGYIIYAYCLMSNHIYLLMKEVAEDLAIVFRRLGPSYVYWYNWKYGRRGHLFQDRYKSEVVETDSYFRGHKGRGHKGTVLLCCFFRCSGVGFTSGVRGKTVCQAPREKWQWKGSPRRDSLRFIYIMLITEKASVEAGSILSMAIRETLHLPTGHKNLRRCQGEAS